MGPPKDVMPSLRKVDRTSAALLRIRVQGFVKYIRQSLHGRPVLRHVVAKMEIRIDLTADVPTTDQRVHRQPPTACHAWVSRRRLSNTWSSARTALTRGS